MIDLTATSYDTPFRASEIKLKRAKQHIEELKSVIEAYLAAGVVRVGSIPGDTTPGYRILTKGVPNVIGAIAGDIFHNLRACLDLMACELCRLNGKSQDGVYFPFCDKAEDLGVMIKRRKFDRTGPLAVKLLKEFAPYKGGNIELRAIHDLDIQDKHQALLPGRARTNDLKIQVFPEPKLVSKLEVKLLMPKGWPLEDMELVPTLEKLVELTAGIVEAFKALPVPPR